MLIHGNVASCLPNFVSRIEYGNWFYPSCHSSVEKQINSSPALDISFQAVDAGTLIQVPQPPQPETSAIGSPSRWAQQGPSVLLFLPASPCPLCSMQLALCFSRPVQSYATLFGTRRMGTTDGSDPGKGQGFLGSWSLEQC